MRILLVNVPHPSIGSRIPDDHLPPLGLLAIGGPLIDAEFGRCRRRKSSRGIPLLPGCRIVRPLRPDLGPSRYRRSGRRSQLRCHAYRSSMAGSSRPITGAEILSQESYATAIVRCEGEETVRRLMRALEPRQPIGEVAGVAYRKAGRPCATRPAPVIRDLDAYRIGWELIDRAPLQLLGRLARRGGAVLAWLSALLQLLRPTRFLDALAASRSGSLRIRSGAVAS